MIAQWSRPSHPSRPVVPGVQLFQTRSGAGDSARPGGSSFTLWSINPILREFLGRTT